MKKLLIMSMALLFSLPNFSQTRTVSRNPGNKTDVTRPSKDDAKGQWDSRLTLLRPTAPGGKTAVTRPGKDNAEGQWDSRLTLLRPTEPGGKTAVTRPSVSDEQPTTLPTLLDKTGGRNYDKTKVVRPAGTPLKSSSRGGTRRR